MQEEDKAMSLKRRKHTREFKLQVLREIEAGKSIVAVAREHESHPALITKWQNNHAKYAESAFAGNGRSYKDEARIGELERKVGQLTLENDFLKKALQRLEMLKQEKKSGRL
jgi:transposase